ncbi:MAG: thrombospondin type 3 repeat-containing protein [Patescibacteria group bacterium]
MAHSTRTLRIAGASLLAVLMMGGTFLSTGPNPFFGMTRIAGAQSSEELLREYAAKDSDTDGLPDWQEALYGTDPLNPESYKAGVKDGEAVAQGLIEPKVMVRPEDEPIDPDSIPGTAGAPSSLTDRFAQTLLKQYLLNRTGTPPTQEEIVAFVQEGVAELSSGATEPDRYTLADVKVSSTATLTSYAADAEAAIAANTVSSSISSRNELAYFQDAIRGDATALAKISAYSKAYDAMAKALIAMPVPEESRQAHLAIVNATMHLSGTTADMATLTEDPLRALLGIGLYGKYAAGMKSGFSNLNSVFRARQVSFTEGQPGYEFFNTSELAAIQ